MIAIASELANKVRETKKSPGYGHPVTATVATGHGPCRHCLRPFVVGQDVRMLFTLNPFNGVAPIPQPGPVFIHETECVRYVETAGYPAELVPFAAVLDGGSFAHFGVRGPQPLDDSVDIKKAIGSAIPS